MKSAYYQLYPTAPGCDIIPKDCTCIRHQEGFEIPSGAQLLAAAVGPSSGVSLWFSGLRLHSIPNDNRRRRRLDQSNRRSPVRQVPSPPSSNWQQALGSISPLHEWVSVDFSTIGLLARDAAGTGH